MVNSEILMALDDATFGILGTEDAVIIGMLSTLAMRRSGGRGIRTYAEEVCPKSPGNQRGPRI